MLKYHSIFSAIFAHKVKNVKTNYHYKLNFSSHHWDVITFQKTTMIIIKARHNVRLLENIPLNWLLFKRYA